MSRVQIDLNTTVIRPDLRIWRVFPGSGYKFLEIFRNDSKVFLDLPGLELPDGVIDRDTESLIERIRRSLAVIAHNKALKVWSAAREPTTPPAKPPSDLQAYRTLTDYGTGIRERTKILEMFGSAQKGDLFLTPDRPRSRLVHIGVFTTDPTVREVVEISTFSGSDYTAARSVRWLNSVNELRLEKEVSLALRHEQPISSLAIFDSLKIFDLAYGTYVFGNRTKAARLDTGSAEFSEQDNFDFGILLKLAAQLGWDDLSSAISPVSFQKYFEDVIPDEGSLSVSLNVNSLGFLNAKGFTLGAILFVVLLSLSGHANLSRTQLLDVTVINSGDGGEQVLSRNVKDIIEASMRNMGDEEWESIKRRGSRLLESAQIRVSPRLTLLPD